MAPSSTRRRPVHLDVEIDVAGRVDDVDPVVLPLARHGGGGDGDAALALLLHVVGRGVAVVDLADLVGHPGVVQDPLGRGRLARVDMRGDADVANLVERRASHGNLHTKTGAPEPLFRAPACRSNRCCTAARFARFIAPSARQHLHTPIWRGPATLPAAHGEALVVGVAVPMPMRGPATVVSWVPHGATRLGADRHARRGGERRRTGAAPHRLPHAGEGRGGDAAPTTSPDRGPGDQGLGHHAAQVQRLAGALRPVGFALGGAAPSAPPACWTIATCSRPATCARWPRDCRRNTGNFSGRQRWRRHFRTAPRRRHRCRASPPCSGTGGAGGTYSPAAARCRGYPLSPDRAGARRRVRWLWDS